MIDVTRGATRGARDGTPAARRTRSAKCVSSTSKRKARTRASRSLPSSRIIFIAKLQSSRFSSSSFCLRARTTLYTSPNPPRATKHSTVYSGSEPPS